jgi:hypothetical protein
MRHLVKETPGVPAGYQGIGWQGEVLHRLLSPRRQALISCGCSW